MDIKQMITIAITIDNPYKLIAFIAVLVAASYHTTINNEFIKTTIARVLSFKRIDFKGALGKLSFKFTLHR